MIYRGRILNLRVDDVTVVNGISKREIIEHNGGSVIAAVTKDNRMVMVRQFRKPAGKVLLEAPAGKRDGNEALIDTAIRELREETGYTAREMKLLTRMYTSPGYSTEVLGIFLATGITPGVSDPDENEALDVVHYPVRELVAMVMSSEIEDGKSQAAILMAARELGI